MCRIAKRFIDGKNFYGGLLHVFYVPEVETITETRAKLFQRRRDISIRIKRNQQDMLNPDADKFIPKYVKEGDVLLQQYYNNNFQGAIS